MVGQNNFRNKIPGFCYKTTTIFSPVTRPFLLLLHICWYFKNLKMLETCLGLGIVKLFLAASAPYWLPHNNAFWIFVGHLLTDTKVRCRGNLLTNSEQPRSVQPQIVIHCHLKRLYRSLEDWKPFQSCLEFFLDIKTMQFLPRKWKKKH